MQFFLRILRLLAPIGSVVAVTGRAVAMGLLKASSKIVPKLINRKVKLFGVEYAATDIYFAVMWYMMESLSPGLFGARDSEAERSGRKSFDRIFGKRQSKMSLFLRGARGLGNLIWTWFRTNKSKPAGSKKALTLPALGNSDAIKLSSEGNGVVVYQGGKKSTFEAKAAKFIGISILMDYLLDALLNNVDLTELFEQIGQLYSEYWEEDDVDVVNNASKSNIEPNLRQDDNSVQGEVTSKTHHAREQAPLTFSLLRAMLHGDTLTPGEYVRYDESKAVELVNHRNLGMHMDEVIGAFGLNSLNARQVVRSLAVLMMADMNDIYDNYHQLRKTVTDKSEDNVSEYFLQQSSTEGLSDDEVDNLISEFVATDPEMAEYDRDDQIVAMQLEGLARNTSRLRTFVQGD